MSARAASHVPAHAINLAAALLLAVGGPCAWSAETLTNGSFEAGAPGQLPPGWQVGRHYGKVSPGATFTTDTTVSQEGTASLRITSRTADIPAIALSRPIDVEAGATYVLSAYLRAETPVAARVMVVPADFKGISTLAPGVSNAWQRCELTFKARAPVAVNLRFDLMQAGTLWVDHVAFEKTKPGTGILSDARSALPPREVADGGFERAEPGALPAGWQVGKHYDRIPTGAVFAVDGTVAHSGSHSLKITSPGDEGIPAIALSSPVAVDPGEAYVITAWMRSAARTAEAQIMALRTDYKGADRAPVVLTDTWRRYRLVFKASPGAPSYYARFDAGQGTTWIDDVAVAKVAAATNEAAGPALGYRYGTNGGDKAVTLTVGRPTGHAWAMKNGICYARGFGSRQLSPVFGDTRVKVVRLHNVLTHLGILQKQADGTFGYDYTTLDQAVRDILAIGAVPQISLCFVPVEMVRQPDPAKVRESKYFLGQPDDYGQWEDYVYHVVRHCDETFPGMPDWYWIFGNEPGVRQFSMGTQEEYYRLYQHTLAAAVRAQPGIQIGAGSFAHMDWLKAFVEHCAADHTRLDVLSWHHYDVVPDDFSVKIQSVRDIIAPYPGLARVKLAIDEWNSILPDDRPAAGSCGNYAAAHAAASIYAMMKGGLAYQTHFIATSPHGWGMMNKDVKQPVFNAFQLLGMMGTNEVHCTVPDGEPYVGGFATQRDDGTLTLLVWHAKSKNDISPDAAKTVTVAFDGPTRPAAVTRYVIDNDHSNGLNDPRRQDLETVDNPLLEGPGGVGSQVRFEAPPNSVSLLVVAPAR